MESLQGGGEEVKKGREGEEEMKSYFVSLSPGVSVSLSAFLGT